jgi:molybdopterin converting factor small subunit
MPTISIRLIGSLQVLMGTKTIPVDLAPDATVRDLLITIQRDYPKLAARILLDDQPDPDVLIAVNGSSISLLHGLDTSLAGVNEVILIPPLMGG